MREPQKPRLVCNRVRCSGVAGIVGHPATVAAGEMRVLVPAYFYPGTGGPGGVGDGWSAMAAAASQISVTAIFNPDSGPLPGPPDPNDVTALTNLEARRRGSPSLTSSPTTATPLWPPSRARSRLTSPSTAA